MEKGMYLTIILVAVLDIALSASDPMAHSSPTLKHSDQATALLRKQPRLPPPRPAPPTTPPSVLTDSPLQAGQCELGTRIDSRSGQPTSFAAMNVAYVDVGSPAQCSGQVAGWELCYRMSGYGASVFDLLLLSRVSDGTEYRVRAVHSVSVEQPEQSEQTLFDVSCVYITTSNNVSIVHGDYIGFICNDDIQIGFVSNNGDTSSLRAHNLTSINQDRTQQTQRKVYKRQGTGSTDIDTIPSSKLQALSEVPLFRIVINESEVMPSRTTTGPCPTNNGGPTTIFTTAFTSVVIVSVVVIFILFIVVCLMGCYICQLKCKCIKKCCRCCRKRNVVHRITVQPITDQSMQYNDLYTPQDPHQIISGGKLITADIHGNPAYQAPTSNQLSSASFGAAAPSSSRLGQHNLGLRRALPSQDALSTATELSTLDHYDTPSSVEAGFLPKSTTSDSFAQGGTSSEMDLGMQDMFEDSREFDHTYEMIQSGKFVQ